jgi:NAD(P)H-hydrate epimerase
MIKGNGIDIIEVERIKNVLDGKRKFIDRIFTAREKAYINSRKQNPQTVAGMFAAKEAVSKALGSGIRGFSFKDIEIIRDSLGKPMVVLNGNAKEIAQRLKIGNIYLSISHTDKYAVASAVAEDLKMIEKDIYTKSKETSKQNEGNIIDSFFIKNVIPIRKSESHKGTYGKVSVVAGSKGMTGASYLTSIAALRSGSGIVYTFIPDSLYEIMAVKTIEIITKPVYDMNKGHFVKESIDEIMKTVLLSDVVAIGPGLGVGDERIELVSKLLDSIDKPVVLDADGINCIAKNKKALKERKYATVITPHPGELSMLLDVSIDEVQSNRIKYAKLTSEKYGVITVLKGSNTVIVGTDGEVFINPTGNPGMATAGSGDVLTGIIASFIGQGIEILRAVLSGVYIHGLAGDLASEDRGQYGVIASDIVEKIPNAIKKIVGV